MKSWQVDPRGPFNTRIWSEIATELFKEQILTGCAHLTVDISGKVRLLQESDDFRSQTARNPGDTG